MNIRKIGILGGSGFVGCTFACQLINAGYELKILTRRYAEKHRSLSALPGLELVEADIHDQARLSTHLSGCDAAVNLVGIALLRLMPGIFPLACARARFAPVFVENVAKTMADTLADPAHYGKRYDLCGPRSYPAYLANK